MQETNFPIEILIHDDASTDGTADIIREYEQKYPEIIKPIYQTENQYSKGIKISQTFNWSRAKGKYIAICEGDDYWIDPYKLQKQVDFLENNPDYGLCYTKAFVYYQSRQEMAKNKIWGKKFNTIEELLTMKRYPIPTLTVCLRKELLFRYLEEIKPETRNWRIFGDIPLTLWFKHNSQIYFIEQFTGVYRLIPNSFAHRILYEDKIKFIEERQQIRMFFIKLYNIPKLERVINNRKLMECANQAIIFKKYDEYSNFISNVDDNSRKIKLKKLIGKYIFLMIVYNKYLKLRKIIFTKR